MADKPRVAICIPSGDTWKAHTARCVMALGIFSAPEVHIMPINVRTQDTAESRNQMTREALRHGAEWFLWIDADMVFPADALVRLLRRKVDIIGADYRRRSPPFPKIGKPIGLKTEENLIEVTFIGLGFLLVRAGVLRRMGEPYFVRAWMLDQATADNPSGFSTEDSYFCGHARHLGYHVWCDLDLTAEVGHICEAPIPWAAAKPQVPGVECLQTSA